MEKIPYPSSCTDNPIYLFLSHPLQSLPFIAVSANSDDNHRCRMG